MTIRHGSLAAVLACLLWTQAAADDLSELRSGLSTLHQIQDDIARGDTGSRQFQAAILAHIADSLESLPEASLSSPEVQVMLVETSLSGGDRSRMVRLIDRIDGKEAFAPLLTATRHYLLGEMKKAAAAFSQLPLDGNALTRVDHLIALAIGNATIDHDPEAARKALEMAILLAPGTLVEEVALRRLAGLSVKADKPDLFLRSANLYLRRYGRSPYAREFLRHAEDGAYSVATQADMKRLATQIMLLQSSDSLPLLVSISGRLLAHGKVDVARVAVNTLAEALDEPGKPDLHPDIRILGILVDMENASPENRLAELKDLRPAPNYPRSHDLLQIARHVIWNMHKPLARVVDPKLQAEEQDGASGNEFAEADRIVAHAKAVLDAAGEERPKAR